MLKAYYRSPESPPPLSVSLVSTASAVEEEDYEDGLVGAYDEDQDCTWVANVETEPLMKSKLEHLLPEQSSQLSQLLSMYGEVFASDPGRTDWMQHDVDVGDAEPIKLPPYRVNPQRLGVLQEELKYMLDRGLISPCVSPWSSLVTLQPKSDGTTRFCIDYRRVNSVTKTDTYPLPRLEDCIDRIGSARFISKLDLKKGFWQVPLTERAKEVSCFVVNNETFQCNVMPYGMKNSPATFQRLMNKVVQGMKHCVVYIDDVVIFTEDWESHLSELELLLSRLSQAHLVVNLKKCDFVHAQVQ